MSHTKNVLSRVMCWAQNMSACWQAQRPNRPTRLQPVHTNKVLFSTEQRPEFRRQERQERAGRSVGRISCRCTCSLPPHRLRKRCKSNKSSLVIHHYLLLSSAVLCCAVLCCGVLLDQHLSQSKKVSDVIGPHQLSSKVDNANRTT
jgi:hypothetical protein